MVLQKSKLTLEIMHSAMLGSVQGRQIDYFLGITLQIQLSRKCYYYEFTLCGHVTKLSNIICVEIDFKN